MNTDIFEHKDIWMHRHPTFAVEISRHEVVGHDSYEGPNRWAVYCYIYPNHPLFKEFKNENMWQAATSELPFHCGCSIVRKHEQNGAITSWQAGADYNHDGDSYYTRLENRVEAHSVFNDAKRLVEHLEKLANGNV